MGWWTRTRTGLATVAACLGGSAACVDSAPRPQPAACEVVPPVPYTGPAVIPSGDTTTPGPYLWKNVVIKGGGFVSGIITSHALPGLVYARTDVGGVYRSDPANRRWIPITDWVGRNDGNFTGVESVAADPVDPNRVYIAAGQYLTAGYGSILSSSDMGRTWARHAISAAMGGNVNGRSMGERLVVDPNLPSTLYFASRNTGLWKSTDYAQTWSVVGNFPTTGAGMCNMVGVSCGLTFVAFDQRSGTSGNATPVIFVGVGSIAEAALYRSIDAGASWQVVMGAPAGMMPHHGVPDGCGNLYLAYNDWAGPNDIRSGAIWRLDTTNDRWTDVSPPKRGGGFGGISVDAANSRNLLVSTIDLWAPDDIYRSTDGGVSWREITDAARRDDNGAKWLYWHTPSVTATGWMGDIEIDPFNPSRALYVTGQGIWSSDDVTAADTGAATSWRFDDDGLEETVPLDLASPPGASLLSALGDIAGFRHDSLDVSPPGGMFANPIFGNTNSIDFAEAMPNIVARVGTNSRAGEQRGAYSTDGGTTWTPFGNTPMATGAQAVQSGTIAVSADGATFLWSPQRGVPSYSRDRGATWTACAGLPNNARVAADRVNPLKFYANGGNRMHVSTDGGATFTPACATGDTCPSVSGRPRPVFGIEGDVWLTTNTALFHSRDSGATWRAVPQVLNTAAVGFGMAPAARSYPAVYISAALNGAWGVYRSDNADTTDQAGPTWQRIDDDQHQFGYVNHVAGDQRLFGRVYIGTGGRGVLYGEPR
jgi:hypothetical protein